MMDMNIKYGDIVLMDFNPVRGAEISKIRPCIVVSNDTITTYSPLVVVIPLTSNIKKILSFHLLIKISHKNGLANNSKALTEQIKSLDKSRLVKKLGTLEKNLLSELEKKILFIVNQSDDI
jgi:mRNA interferase MazF